MFQKVFVPYKGYWSSPFSKWQGSFQSQDAIKLCAQTATKFFELRGYTPQDFKALVLSTTIPQKAWFYNSPHFATLMGNPDITGPQIAQACASSTVSVNYAACNVEVGQQQDVLVAACDRMSNGPNILWPAPTGPGGQPEFESWVMDGFSMDPTAGTNPTGTAENTAKKYGFTREQSDDMAVRRYDKYTDALANDREFQKRYMIGVDVQVSRKKTITIDADEGITPCTHEGLAKLKTRKDCVLTFGAQTHPADGNAGMVVTTKEKADEFSADKNVTIQILSYGTSRVKKAFMPTAPVPAALNAMKAAGITVDDLAAVKTHNPFSMNDLYMQKELGIDEKIFNNYGSSMVFGHPQGPTTMRLLVEMIEELVMKGGGYGLQAGCAAGDSGAAMIVKVN
ncbi:thiolase family protein [Desulfobacula sp.]|uniref:thiolase family protein n=1 Tax=Desulfobacula sp. TaxID=2593537 RepID=UPI0026391C39|nr:thiolase family protein [Desulfobacula sp.]